MTEVKQFSVVGVDNAYYAIVTDSPTGYTAGTPKKLTQTMELKGNSKEGTEIQYADNTVHDLASAEGPTEFELMAPNIGEDTLAELLGETLDTDAGRIYDDADPTTRPYFALGYRFKKSNGKYRYRWYLKCRAEKPNEEGVSESDKVNFKASTLKISAIKTQFLFDIHGDGTKLSGAKRVRGDEDLTNFDPTDWFTAVQTPPLP